MEWTEEQLRALDSPDRPMALIAGAGSGKTAVLVGRYLKCLERTGPDAILTVTFTRDAAKEMRERIARELVRRGEGEKAQACLLTPSIGTIHSLCFSILSEFGPLLGLPPLQGVATELELTSELDRHYPGWLTGLEATLAARLFSYFSARELREMVRLALQSPYAWQKALQAVPPDASEAGVARTLEEALCPLLHHVTQGLYAQGKYAFSDLEYWAMRILTEIPAAKKRLRDRYAYLLVDEFQDTSPLQWELLRELIQKNWQGLFIVGDPKQSIYRFRQADYRLFLSVAQKIRACGGDVGELSINFRSTDALLDAVNPMATYLFLHGEVGFTPMGAVKTAGGGAALRVLRYPVEGRRQEGHAAERALAVATVQALIQKENVAPESIAVLFRVGEGIPDVAASLQTRGIPSTTEKASRLFELLDAEDLLNFFRAVADPDDDLSVAAFLRSSFLRWNEKTLSDLCRNPGKTLREKLSQEPALAWLRPLFENPSTPAMECLERLVAETDYWPKDFATLLEILEPLTVETVTADEAARKLAAWKREEVMVTPHPEHAVGVRLMTVHGAKGLEFDHVLLVDGLRTPPHATPPWRLCPPERLGLRYNEGGEIRMTAAYERLSAQSKQEELDESRRVLYVALTRARQTVTLLLPQSNAPKNSWAFWLEESLRK